MCDREAQNIRGIIENTLTYYGINFNGWSALARKTCLKYGLPDPLQYLKHPWRPDRWRDHCKRAIQDYWEKNLLQEVNTTPSLVYVDTDYASLSIPMRVWQLAGLCSENARQAAIVNWMLLGVYFTRELLHKMKKIKSPNCLGCPQNTNENLSHFLLHCSYYKTIREGYLPKYIQQNSYISEILDDQDLILQMVLDPLSSKLPDNVKNNWLSANEVYKISRQFCYNMHRKREKFYTEFELEKTS